MVRTAAATSENKDPVRGRLTGLAEWGLENTGALTLGELIDDIRISEDPIQPGTQ